MMLSKVKNGNKLWEMRSSQEWKNMWMDVGPWIGTVVARTRQDVTPQFLGNDAGFPVLAGALLGLTLGTVPQKQQPSLLLRNVVLLGCCHLSTIT